MLLFPLLALSYRLKTLWEERQPAAVPELPNDQPYEPPKQSHAEDHTEQIEATGEDHR